MAGLPSTKSRLGSLRDNSGILELSYLEEGTEIAYGSKSWSASAMSERHGVIQLQDSGQQDHVLLRVVAGVRAEGATGEGEHAAAEGPGEAAGPSGQRTRRGRAGWVLSAV